MFIFSQRLAFLLLFLVTMAVSAWAEKATTEDNDTSWDVSEPPGQWRDITIDTETTTWSFVDVSPDGRQIIFDMLGDIYSVPMAGGEAKTLAGGIAWDFQPTFSPDGRQIAFISDRDGADNLWIMNADGSEATQVSKEEQHLLHNPAWSPDGQWLSARKGYVSRRSIPAGEIWLYHRQGGKGTQLVARPGGENAQKFIGEPAYSPDGRYLYYSQDVSPGTRFEYNKDATGQIFVIKRLDLLKGDTLTLTGGPGGAVRPVPSPDGNKLAFVKRHPNLSSALYVRDLASGNETLVYEGLDRDNQESAGSHGNTPGFDWLPDNQSLVFWAAGKIHRLNTTTGALNTVPIRINTRKRVQQTLRFPVEVAPDHFDVNMLRWGQYSADGKRVIFQALGHLYARAVTGETPKRLTRQQEHLEFWPSLSANGRELVYTTWDDEALGRVRTVSSRGGKGRIVVSEPGHYIEPQFSPDGRQIVYRKITGGYLLSPLWSAEPGIYRVAAKGGKPVKLSSQGEQPQFSANGQRVFFSVNSDKGRELKSVNLEGLDERSHAVGKYVTHFNVSPDGRWLAFTEHFNAYISPLTDAAKAIDVGRHSQAVPVKQVSQRAGDFLRWSSDSQSLHWMNGPTLYSQALNHAFDFLAGAPESLPEPVRDGLSLRFSVAADKPRGLIALEGAQIVTMRQAHSSATSGQATAEKILQEVLHDATVVIADNRIQAVGPRGDVEIPANAFVVDVRGHTIIPGLIDSHAHGSMGRQEVIPQQNWMQYSNLAFGVTTIHDPSNDTSEVFAHAEMQRRGQVLGPRTYSTGTILYGAHLPGYTSEVNSLEEARFHIRRLKDAGAISVKSYNQLGRDSRQQLIAAAQSLGIMVVPEGGMKLQHNLTHIVDGHTSLEHSLPIANFYDDVKQLWQQTDTTYSPTFGVAYGGIWGENYWYDRTQVWKNPRLLRYSPRQFVEPRSMRRTRAPDHHYNHFKVAAGAKMLNDLGVAVVIGAHGQREGLAAHWEMWMMHQGGFSPWQALRGATLDAATHLGMDRDLGSIEVGKLADLVVIDGDPLTDLRRSEYVKYTMINGRLYDVATMNELGSGKRQRQPFFFERTGGNVVPTATTEAMAAKAERYHWAH